MVIPQIGAFLVKEPGRSVVFSQLITRDDGVLRSLLLDKGVSELECSGIVQRLQFDLRYLLENGGDYILEGVGRFSLDQSGQLLFVELPPVVHVVESDPFAEVLSTQPIAAEKLPEEATQVAQVAAPAAIEPLPAAQPPITAEVAQVEEIEPDPDLEGMSYTPDRKSGRRGAKKASSGKRARKGGIDVWLVVGIAAMVLAIGAILYGFLREGAQSSFDLTLFESVEE